MVRMQSFCSTWSFACVALKLGTYFNLLSSLFLVLEASHYSLRVVFIGSISTFRCTCLAFCIFWCAISPIEQLSISNPLILNGGTLFSSWREEVSKSFLTKQCEIGAKLWWWSTLSIIFCTLLDCFLWIFIGVRFLFQAKIFCGMLIVYIPISVS